jgi:hypothetical protein
MAILLNDERGKSTLDSMHGPDACHACLPEKPLGVLGTSTVGAI